MEDILSIVISIVVIVAFVVFIVNIIQYYIYYKIKNSKYRENMITKKLKRKNMNQNYMTEQELLEFEKKIKNDMYKRIFLSLIIMLIFIKMLVNFISQATETSITKPIIYLYPEEETRVTVELGSPEKLTCSYPKYENRWKVIAKPNGDLVDCDTGRNLYALYWEGKDKVKSSCEEGFIVKGEDSSKFLEEKLEILGLNARETEEFIVYWLPKLEKNAYNYIYFETIQEINNDMILNINPKPDSLIRVMMIYKKIDKPYKLQEQELETPKREGFVVVEWGGIELD